MSLYQIVDFIEYHNEKEKEEIHDVRSEKHFENNFFMSENWF